MDTQNVSPAPGSASDLSATITALQSRAEAQLEALTQSRIALRDCQPYYNEVAADYEARQARAQAEADYQERLAAEVELDLQSATAPIRKRLDGRESIGLSPSEWEKAGTLSALATSRVAEASLADAVAELRSAITAGDKPRMAAFLTAAEARLRAPAPASGKVSFSDQQADRDLRQVIGEAKHALRDRTLDPVREKLQRLTATRGDLSLVLIKARAQRTLDADIASGKLVRWPTRDAKTGVWSHVGQAR